MSKLLISLLWEKFEFYWSVSNLLSEVRRKKKSASRSRDQPSVSRGIPGFKCYLTVNSCNSLNGLQFSLPDDRALEGASPTFVLKLVITNYTNSNKARLHTINMHWLVKTYTKQWKITGKPQLLENTFISTYLRGVLIGGISSTHMISPQ